MLWYRCALRLWRSVRVLLGVACPCARRAVLAWWCLGLFAMEGIGGGEMCYEGGVGRGFSVLGVVLLQYIFVGVAPSRNGVAHSGCSE